MFNEQAFLINLYHSDNHLTAKIPDIFSWIWTKKYFKFLVYY